MACEAHHTGGGKGRWLVARTVMQVMKLEVETVAIGSHLRLSCLPYDGLVFGISFLSRSRSHLV